MNLKRLIPDSFTCCNLLCGSVAVYMATQQSFVAALLLICGGALFDFCDGSSARLLKVPSPIGVELDSLADDITFGLAPSMMLFCYLRDAIGWWALIALLMAPFSALRLAKFNLDQRQKSSFIGLATPPNAIFWASMCCQPFSMLQGIMPWVLLGMSLVSCYLLISEIPFFGLKFHSLKWKESRDQYIFLIGCLVLLAVCIIRVCQFSCPHLFTLLGAACVIWYILFNTLLLFLKR